jgi:predicted dehydrogenase
MIHTKHLSVAMRISVIYITLVIVLGFAASAHAQKPIRLGIIGLDTSHVIAFTRIVNDPNNKDHVPGARVVAAFKGGSPDIPSSANRVDKFTAQLRDKWGVEIVDSIPELCSKVDGILLTSVDGRPHLAQARPVIEAGLPLFIDKPVAGTLEDVIAIAKLAKKHNVPWFGGSSLRWWTGMREAIDPATVGSILGCDAYSPCSLEPHHPDLFWYGVHGVEILYTVMGTGCVQVSRASTKDTELVTGVWKDGRIGTFRGTRKGKHSYGATVFGSKRVVTTEGHSYKGQVEQIVLFFQTGKPPISAEEIIEMYAFMAAADDSKRAGGKPVAMPKFSLE